MRHYRKHARKALITGLAFFLFAAPLEAVQAVGVSKAKRHPCEQYKEAWDKKAWKKQQQKEFARALEIRRAGEALCNTGRSVLGQQALIRALKMMKIKVPK